MKGKYDVLIITKNSEKYLSKCLDGLIKSGTPINRLIIIDKDSTDSTFSIINNYCILLNIPLVFRQQTGRGVGQARAQGLELIETPYFISLDSDVILPKDWFIDLFPLIYESGNLMVSSYLIFGDGTPFSHYYEWRRTKRRNQPTLGCSIIKTNALRNIGGIYPYHAGEDSELFERIKFYGKRAYTDYDTIAINPRSSIEELQHAYWWATGSQLVDSTKWYKGFFGSFYLGLILCKRSPSLLILMPLRGFVWLLGYIRGYLNTTS